MPRRATEDGATSTSRAPRRPAASPAARALAAAGGLLTGAVLAAIAAVRRAKAVHPHGAGYAARLVVHGAPAAPAGAALLCTAAEHRAVVRFSRSLGLPRPVPDLLGISIRVLDAHGPGRHQDFLLVTSADIPVVHHVFLPARDVQQRPYSSSLPYRAGRDVFLVGALPHADSPRPEGRTELDRLRAAAATGRLRFHLAVAPVMGRFTPVAELRIGAPLPAVLDALRFDPWNTGGGLEPAGVLNRMRRYAYPMSQWAWRRARPGGASLQDAADRQLELVRAATGEAAGGASDPGDAG
jgi:hypothetical protein